MTGMDDDAFDTIMARLDAPMTIVTTTDGRERAGCLVGFHSQAGMAPDALAVWLSQANHTYRVAVLADSFAVHFLSRRHLELARLFGTRTGDEIDKFEHCAWHPGPDGVPVLDDCDAVVVGRKRALLQTGVDHVCLVLDPVRMRRRCARSTAAPVRCVRLPARSRGRRATPSSDDAERSSRPGRGLTGIDPGPDAAMAPGWVGAIAGVSSGGTR